jgi:serine/threonine protein kinase
LLLNNKISILLLKNISSRPSSAAFSRPPSARPLSALPTFYAIKCINRKSLTKTTEDLLINEIKLLKQIKHENIVEMYDFQVNKVLFNFLKFNYFPFIFKVG